MYPCLQKLLARILRLALSIFLIRFSAFKRFAKPGFLPMFCPLRNP